MSPADEKLSLGHVDIFDDHDDGTKTHVARVVPAGDFVAFRCQGSKPENMPDGFSWLTRVAAVEFATAILGVATGVFSSPHIQDDEDALAEKEQTP